MAALDTAEDLRRRRAARGLTQEQLAVRAGVASSTIGNVESGRRRPQRSTWAALLLALADDQNDDRVGDRVR